jgi:hypothetical protein
LVWTSLFPSTPIMCGYHQVVKDYHWDRFISMYIFSLNSVKKLSTQWGRHARAGSEPAWY